VPQFLKELAERFNALSEAADNNPTIRSLFRTGLLVLCLGVFLMIPMRILSYGYLPPDDALRHSAYAVSDREWGDIMLINPELRPDIDGQAGWHSFLKMVYRATNWTPGQLVSVSVALGLLTFMMGGLIASGNPPAWFMACAVMSVLEPALFGKLALGRPLFLTMASVAILLFVWTRENPLKPRVETLVTFAVLSVSIVAHSSAWYLWAIAIPPLVLCRRWRSLATFAVAWPAAVGVACIINGPYNAILTPLLGLKLGVVHAKTLGPNLVSELQPSGAPYVSLLAVAMIVVVKVIRGSRARQELMQPDLCFALVAWMLGLYVSRFWVEWGLPALLVWFTRQIRDGLNVGLAGLPRAHDTVVVFTFAAGVMYLIQTADVGGRYTNALRNPALWAPEEELRRVLPEDGGIFYSSDNRTFFVLFHRLPHAKFKYATAMEAGVMPPDDLKVLRAIQSRGTLNEYKPWFEKMTPKDRIFIQHPSKPEWPSIHFRPFFGGWIGSKTGA
jgi:hypothetical protein